MRRPSRPFATTAWLVGAFLLSSSTARADEDCPPGSVHKAEDGFSWCEPTVCTNDGQCKPNEVCRPVALCMQVGTLGDAASDAAGKRLVVTQRCVAGELGGDPKTCPQKQTCSNLNRCVAKTAAEKMGLLEVASAPSTAPASGAGGEAKRTSCGCDVVGARSGTSSAVAVGLALSLFAVRRKRSG
jgi:hypothetical protein